MARGACFPIRSGWSSKVCRANWRVLLWRERQGAAIAPEKVTMKAFGSLATLLIAGLVVVFIFKYYVAPQQSTGAAASPVHTIDAVGVQNDLIAIAQAERAYQAEHGKYASLDELTSSGAMAMRKEGRGGYTYEVDASDDSFRAIARCDDLQGCQSYAIDQTMSVQPAP